MAAQAALKAQTGAIHTDAPGRWSDPMWLATRVGGAAVVALLAIGLLLTLTHKDPDELNKAEEARYRQDVNLIRGALQSLPPWPRERRDGTPVSGQEVLEKVRKTGRLGRLAREGLVDPWGGPYTITVDMDAGPADPTDGRPVGEIRLASRGPGTETDGARARAFAMRWTAPKKRAASTTRRGTTEEYVWQPEQGGRSGELDRRTQRQRQRQRQVLQRMQATAVEEQVEEEMEQMMRQGGGGKGEE